ncbi:MAG: hypothetical protein ABI867_41175 [Kofleriaceae bacterium]
MFRIVALVSVLMVPLAGCEKTSDVGAMQDEANGIAASYKARFEGLGTRFRTLDERSRKLPPAAVAKATDLAILKRVAADTNNKLGEMRGLAQNVPAQIAAANKAENPRAEMIRVMGDLNRKFEDGALEVNANLDRVEGWISYLELRPIAPDVAPPPTPAPTPEESLPPPAGAGSAAPPAH